MPSLQLYEETFMLLYSPSALLYYCRAAGVILPTFFFSALHPFLQTLSLFLVSQTFPASRLLGNGHLNDVSKARRHVRRWCQVTHTHIQPHTKKWSTSNVHIALELKTEGTSYHAYHFLLS